jgi:hypothetical protein
LTSVTFRATLETNGLTATGLEVPDAVVEQLGHGKRPPVRATIGTHTYATTVARMGGRFLVPVSAENRAAAGVAAGDDLEVTLALDVAPRQVPVPDDLAAALARVPGARDRFEALAPSHRKEHVRSVEDAKKPETRAKRVARVVEAASGQPSTPSRRPGSGAAEH